MISLKKYLDSADAAVRDDAGTDAVCSCEADQGIAASGILIKTVAAYQSALREMGSCTVEACPATGPELKKSLDNLDGKLSPGMTAPLMENSEKSVRVALQDWGRRTAAHYKEKTAEIKDLLLVMARTAESVGERDHRCAGQISEVTTRLKTIATLEDLSEIRSSIVKSAAELKTSLDRMEVEGKQAIAQLKAEVSVYQAKLEEAEELASKDVLTGLRNRGWVEDRIVRRIEQGTPLAVAIVDIDEFKRVNDEHGHLIGDELLRQFAGELRWSSRAADLLGRWGGDEFILVLDANLAQAEAQVERLRKWMSGSYTVQTRSGPVKLKVQASIGLAELVKGESMKDLLARADEAMYEQKRAQGGSGSSARR